MQREYSILSALAFFLRKRQQDGKILENSTGLVVGTSALGVGTCSVTVAITAHRSQDTITTGILITTCSCQIQLDKKTNPKITGQRPSK